jgi:SpoIIAA-like
MVDQFRFVRDHHKRIKRIGVVTDSHLGDVAEHLTSHFVSAEIRHFPAGQIEAARQWIMNGSRCVDVVLSARWTGQASYYDLVTNTRRESRMEQSEPQRGLRADRWCGRGDGRGHWRIVPKPWLMRSISSTRTG